MKKKWPDTNTLMTWWIHHKLQNANMGEMDDPDEPARWLKEFRQLGPHAVHLELYSLYHNYRLEFVNPHYADVELARHSSY